MGNILFRFFPCWFKPLDEEFSSDEEYNDVSSDDEETDEEIIDEVPIKEDPNKEQPVLNNTYFSSPKKKALLIGINYNDDQYKDDDLNGCVNDLNNLKKFLLTNLNFKEEDIITLTNNEATKMNIQDQILNLSVFSHNNPGSNIWLSYSGHGAQIDTLFDSELKSEIICPSDYMYSGVISDEWIEANFVRLLHPDTNAFALMDCCNSGSNLNLPFKYDSENKYTLNDHGYSKKELESLCNIVKISGCRDDQTSADYFDRRFNEFQGALTNAFLTMSVANPKNILDFYLNILENLKIRNFSQRPVLSFTRDNLIDIDLY